MLRLLPNPHATLPVKSPTAPQPAQRPGHAPAGLLYTILRHGQGLSHDVAQRRQREALEGPFFAA